MISYSSMTFKEAADEVLMRCGQGRTSVNLDYETIKTFLALARREIMARTQPFKDWAYIKSVAVTDGTELPQDFIRKVRSQLKGPSASIYTDGAHLAPREWWRLTNVSRPHKINGASLIAPKWTLWGSSDTADSAWAGKGVIFYCRPANVSGFLEYYASYDDTTTDSATLNVPPDCENLVVAAALSRVHLKIGETEKLPALFKMVSEGIAGVRKQTVARMQTEGINLETLPSRQPTMVSTVTKG